MLPKLQRVFHRMAPLIVVEVDVNASPLVQITAHSARDAVYGLGRVGALILARVLRTVETQVGPISGKDFGVFRKHVVQAERCMMLAQYPINLIA